MKQQRRPSTTHSKKKFIATFIVGIGLLAAIRHGFSIEVPLQVGQEPVQQEWLATTMAGHGEEDVPNETDAAMTDDADLEEEEVWYEDEPDSLPAGEAIQEAEENTSDEDFPVINPVDAPTSPSRPHRIRGVWSYADCFPDVQDVQIVAAQKHGIRPVKNRKEAEALVRSHQLVNICHSPFYVVDDLTHSIPYLVPRAQQLLNTICLNFIDSCQVKGLPPHLPMITSVLRTTDDVSNLQRGNKNATTNSCHCYGTTVDIAYNRFLPVTGTYYAAPTLLRWNEPMKQVLAEVLNDLRLQHLCYVKYERKQGCFHLTCR